MKRISLAATLGLTLAAIPASAATLTSGHVDLIGIGYEGGELEPHSHVEDAVVDGVAVIDQEYDPGDLIVQVSTTAIRNADPAYAPIGVGAGQSYFVAPQDEIPGQPFVGIGLEELDPMEWSGPITLTLTGAVMPSGAVFSFWQTGAPPFFVMSTNDGISAADSVNLTAGDHFHGNWSFTHEGTYELTFEITGTHLTDGAKSASATYSFSVIPEPSSAMLGAFGALALLRRRR
jgi:surface-anchored protein